MTDTDGTCEYELDPGDPHQVDHIDIDHDVGTHSYTIDSGEREVIEHHIE